MKKVLLIALTLFSVNSFAADEPIIDMSNMDQLEIKAVVKNMSKADFMKLYRYYNQAVLDDWDNGAKGEDVVSPQVCKTRGNIATAGQYFKKISSEEIRAISRENKKSVTKLCMKNIL
ncbi:MAG: hypothetical protein ACRC4K_08380 [Plesiomonas shigelloides]